MSKINPVTCQFDFFEAPNDAFKVQLFQGFIFIFTPYERHWYYVGTCSSDYVQSENIVKQRL